MSDELPIRLHRADGVATLTLCRAAEKNVVTPQFLAALHTHAETLHADEQLRCVLLQSEGPLFCVGADVKSMADHLDDLPAYIDSLIRPAHTALLRLAALPVPLVGLLRGTAAGGGASLALACDVLVAARSARLVFAYAQLGTTPDMGLSHALIERVGPRRALQLFLLTDGISMDEAERLGLVQEVAEDHDAESAALRTVARLAVLPGGAAKTLFLHGRHDALAQRLERERQSFLECSRTEAFRERVLAFASERRG
jgi:2-(1,2-epoxy-1,2-dihydrophenyl)acetyl-CoA isomerase